MLYLTTLFNQSNLSTEIPIKDLPQLIHNPEVKNLSEKFRNKIITKDNLKILVATDKLFWIDIDGDNHIKGNFEVNQMIVDLFPHKAWFVSPSGKGLKILVEVDKLLKDRKTTSQFLYSLLESITNYKVDHARCDVAFVTDNKITLSNGIINVPNEIIKPIKQITNTSYHIPKEMSSNFSMLKEILDCCSNQMEYSVWISIVMSILKVYSSNAIHLLESKWNSNIPYSTILKYCEHVNPSILISIYNSRTRVNKEYCSSNRDRILVTGATGAGKSQYAIDEIKSLVSLDESKYCIYVVQSVSQAIDFSEKLKKNNLTFEIIVGNTTYSNSKFKSKITTISQNNTNVKIIQLASLKRNIHFKSINSDKREIAMMFIDELSFSDFTRPSITTSNVQKSFLKSSMSIDMLTYYNQNFSSSDRFYALSLASMNDKSHFVSSIIFQNINTTILTTEELTVVCLEDLGYKKKTIKESETLLLKETCSLLVSDSNYYVGKFTESDFLKEFIDENNFDNVFANKCEYATENLFTIKGKQMNGKNLTVIRNLPSDYIFTIKDIFSSCFSNLEIDPISILYKDSLLQAVGRSIGHRGDKVAYVMIHSNIWDSIKDSNWIYKIEKWNVDIDTELMEQIDSERNSLALLMDKTNKRVSEFKKNEKLNNLKLNLIGTTDKSDIITAKELKIRFGKGYTLKDVTEAFDVKIEFTNKGRYISTIKFS